MFELPAGLNMNHLIDDLRSFSWEASDIFYYYSQKLKISSINEDFINYKNNNDPVTSADLEVNQLIINRINEKYSNIGWNLLSEENKNLGLKNNNDWLWILDPLDGTKDFIQNSGEYAMHLALSYKNVPYLGVVLIPDKEELWISNGEEAWVETKNRSKGEAEFSSFRNLEDMTLVTSKNHRNEVLQRLIDKSNFKRIIRMGSIGCKIASIIRGESDIYISLSLSGQTSPKDWDFAAPEAILKAAGGAITNLENQELTYNKSNFEQGGIIIATGNKENHKNICLKLKEIIKENNIFPLL